MIDFARSLLFTLALTLPACATLPRPGDTVADTAADYFATVCTQDETRVIDLVNAFNASIAPDSITLTCRRARE